MAKLKENHASIERGRKIFKTLELKPEDWTGCNQFMDPAAEGVPALLFTAAINIRRLNKQEITSADVARAVLDMKHYCRNIGIIMPIGAVDVGRAGNLIQFLDDTGEYGSIHITLEPDAFKNLASHIPALSEMR